MELSILRRSACSVAQKTCNAHVLMPTKKGALREEEVVSLAACRDAIGESSVGSAI